MTKSKIKVVVGSKNPIKINAGLQAFKRCFPNHQIECIGVSAPSGVAEQPMSTSETLKGAQNRVLACQSSVQADYYVAFEGGVDMFEYGPATFAYVVIANHHKESVGCSASLPLPNSVYRALLDGEELGPLMDKLFNTRNIKQKGGAIGLLTNGLESREGSYLQAITLALAPFLHLDFYHDAD